MSDINSCLWAITYYLDTSSARWRNVPRWLAGTGTLTTETNSIDEIPRPAGNQGRSN